MNGKLGEHPLAELIREIAATTLTGALRLSRERAKVAIYFESGQLVFATSNLRAHRLREVVMRHGLTEAHLAEFPARASDEEFAAAMIKTGLLKPETLAAIRARQVSDVLRLALLWIDGSWEFDSRVRLADETRVKIKVNRLLLECARHLPADFVASRLEGANSTYLKADHHNTTDLLPPEASILSRASDSVTLKELATPKGVGEEAYRAIYALSLSGFLQRSGWPVALGDQTSRVSTKAPTGIKSKPAGIAANEIDELADVEALFARLKITGDHYEVLDVAKLATIDEIKNAYHALARRFHPDRFHQSGPQLRTEVESAFARIAHAYETLSDPARRADYDARRPSRQTATSEKKAVTTPAKAPRSAKQSEAGTAAARAENSFQHGLAALKGNRHDEGIRFLAEAAMLLPREARYRAQYGHALIRQSNTRRLAETELQAALSLEPENTAYRVMLAELYKKLGLQKRAEGELERALAIDPKNEAARAMLLSLKSKTQKS
jgi:curved DNA-binding protein CbpA